MTPEGRIKTKLNKLLDAYGVYRYMPVSNGMGAPALDYICCFKGMYFSVETKAGMKKMTDRQEATAAKIRAAGGYAFLINESEQTWNELKLWLDSLWD